MEVYLDCAATTPVDPRVSRVVGQYLEEEFGNPASRTHAYGHRALKGVNRARGQVAAALGVSPRQVVFTSGATESNNLVFFGLGGHAERTGKFHIVTTAIEHKAVLEPCAEMRRRGFEVTVIGCDRSGRVCADEILGAIREDTLLVSVMHVNNETGVIQPIDEIAEGLGDHPAFFHVDAAQSFGKISGVLEHSRIDFISISAHKIHGPKGVGALILRERGYDPPPLWPLMFGGGHERGLRPGTLPTHQIAGLGLAAELAIHEREERRKKCFGFREKLFEEVVVPLQGEPVGDQRNVLPNILSVRFPGVDAEALMVALKGAVAISNGSACTSSSYSPSHVLSAMGFTSEEAGEVVRISWCHMTPDPDWGRFRAAVLALRGARG